MRVNSPRAFIWVALLLVAVAVGVTFFSAVRRRERAEPVMPLPVAIEPERVDPWKEAALKAEEDRGEPTGRQAAVNIPAQLRHYDDRRRFLGIQVAEWQKHRFPLPHDFAELAELIREGKLVEAPPLGEAHLLYGVGLSATDEPFTHYDKATRQNVPLFGGEEELRHEYELIADTLKQLREAVDELRKQSRETPARERARRAALAAQVKEKEKEMAALRKRERLLDFFYKNKERRRMLESEYETLAALARDFKGRSYDLGDAASRKEFKMRMLSFVRPAALGVIEAVARSYKEKFDRPLPITSLVRTDEYQRHLSGTNPNATLIDVPPHTTGLAFDIYYRHMTGAEQDYVMAELARLQDEGRVEALRENRDHFHVFAFDEGTPPEEALIRKSMGIASGQPAKAEGTKRGAKVKAQKAAGKGAEAKANSRRRRR